MKKTTKQGEDPAPYISIKRNKEVTPENTSKEDSSDSLDPTIKEIIENVKMGIIND